MFVFWLYDLWRLCVLFLLRIVCDGRYYCDGFLGER